MLIVCSDLMELSLRLQLSTPGSKFGNSDSNICLSSSLNKGSSKSSSSSNNSKAAAAVVLRKKSPTAAHVGTNSAAYWSTARGTQTTGKATTGARPKHRKDETQQRQQRATPHTTGQPRSHQKTKCEVTPVWVNPINSRMNCCRGGLGESYFPRRVWMRSFLAKRPS